MSWHDHYLEQKEAWSVKAQKYADKGKQAQAEDCREVAKLYQRLADEAIDNPSNRAKIDP